MLPVCTLFLSPLPSRERVRERGVAPTAPIQSRSCLFPLSPDPSPARGEGGVRPAARVVRPERMSPMFPAWHVAHVPGLHCYPCCRFELSPLLPVCTFLSPLPSRERVRERGWCQRRPVTGSEVGLLPRSATAVITRTGSCLLPSPERRNARKPGVACLPLSPGPSPARGEGGVRPAARGVGNQARESPMLLVCTVTHVPVAQ